MNISTSTTDLAWTNITLSYEVHQHKQRKTDRFWSGDRVYTELHTLSAKGVSRFIFEFFVNPTTAPSKFYTNRRIRPETFIDRRDWALSDYELYGYPGHKIHPEVLNRARKYGEYTTWSNGDSRRRHGLEMPHLLSVLDVASTICRYWHINLTGRYPLSQEEEFSSVLNALGLGYLWHPNLPQVLNPGVGILTEPIDYEIPPQAPIELTPIEVQKYVMTEQAKTAKPKKCASCHRELPTAVLYIPPGYRIKYCNSCMMFNTASLPIGKYSIEPISND